jgi:hypothetical protein
MNAGKSAEQPETHPYFLMRFLECPELEQMVCTGKTSI